MFIILIGVLDLNSELTWKPYETTEETGMPTLHLMTLRSVTDPDPLPPGTHTEIPMAGPGR